MKNHSFIYLFIFVLFWFVRVDLGGDCEYYMKRFERTKKALKLESINLSSKDLSATLEREMDLAGSSRDVNLQQLVAPTCSVLSAATVTPSPINGSSESSRKTEGQPDPASELSRRIQSLREPRPGNAIVFMVPQEQRERCKSLYAPKKFCIGPYHRKLKQDEMEVTEPLKEFFLRDFLQRPGNSSLDTYETMIKEMEIRARGFYSEIPEMDSEDFLDMLLLDGAFILEVLLSNYEGTLARKMSQYNIRNLKIDFILLENQIPYFILNALFTCFLKSTRGIPNSYTNWASLSTLENLAKKFFELRNPLLNEQLIDGISHLLHLFYLGSVLIPQSVVDPNQGTSHLMLIPSATDLKEFGVSFEKGSEDNFLEVEFKNGTLKLPFIRFGETEKCKFANLVAFEETRDDVKPVTSLFHLFKSLIRNEQDLLIFIRQGMIGKISGNDKDIVELFCNICLHTTLDERHHYLSKLFENIQLYFESKWHRWWTVFKREYFRWPWSIATSLCQFAAIMVLVVQFYWKAKDEHNNGRGNSN